MKRAGLRTSEYECCLKLALIYINGWSTLGMGQASKLTTEKTLIVCQYHYVDIIMSISLLDAIGRAGFLECFLRDVCHVTDANIQHSSCV